MNTLTNERLNQIKRWTWHETDYAPMTDDERVAIIDRLLASEAQLAELRGQSKPVCIVEFSDYLTAEEMVGNKPRRKAVRELFEGALVVGAELFSRPVPPAASQPDAMLCDFYEVKNYPDLVRELVLHVEQLQESAKRNVKPWQDTFPATLLPAYIERIKNADDAVRLASQPHTVPDEAPFGYFAFWPEHGEEFFNKREDAIAFCKEAIDDYRRENADEGCDDRDVTRTCWGIIMQKGAVIEVDDQSHIDFALTDELNACRAAMLQSGNSLVWSGVDWAKGCEPVAHVDKRSAATGSICWTPTGRSLNLEHGTPLFVGNSPVFPDGWWLVPKKPTREMIGAAAGKSMTPIECWEVMLAAAPQHKGK